MSISTCDLVLRNGTVIDPGLSPSPQAIDIGIEKGRISALAQTGNLPLLGSRVIDAAGLYVFPGLIDPHVHITNRVAGNMRGGFGLTSLAAIHGGTTTFFDFTTPHQPNELLSAIDRQLQNADGAVFSDFCLHAVLPAMELDDLWQIEQAIKRGFPSFKAFMLPSRGRSKVDDRLLFAALEACRLYGGLMGVHAENGRLVSHFSRKLLKEGKNGLRYFAASRPNICEAEAIQRALYVARTAGAPIYVYHVTSAEGAQAVRHARQQGLPVYGETCPHYLLFTDGVYSEERGFLFNRVPPIRSQRDQDALWEALADGTFSCVGTDDVATTLTHKRQPPPGPDFTDFPGGMAQVETRLALLHSEGVAKGRISLNRLVYLLTAGPARIFGLYPRKGTIAVGSDADLVLFDPNQEKTITSGELHDGTDYTVYEGWKVKGWPVMSLLRGQVIIDRGKLVNNAGQGQCCPRKIDPEIFKGPAA
ncbi:MAG: dihydropyrimidinase [Deltaproteobacteria bacterium]|nr:dihydropyrimidinase [Deltaproteobacteria bacterium]